MIVFYSNQIECYWKMSFFIFLFIKYKFQNIIFIYEIFKIYKLEKKLKHTKYLLHFSIHILCQKLQSYM